MEDLKTLKRIYPQKYYLKLLCKCLYYFGCGDYWYEQNSRTTFKKILYSFWAVLSNIYIVAVIFNEYLAYTRTDLIEKERNDLMQHTFGHSSIWLKMSVLYLKKNRIRIVLKRFLEDSRLIYSSNAIDKAALSKTIKYCLAVGFVSYGTLCMAELDGVRAHFKEGIPIRTLVTYFPRPSHFGVYINILRFFIEFQWFYLVSIMLLVDSLAISSLIFIEAKFKLLQLYFKDLENTIKVETKSESERNREFKKRFIEGIKLHEDALWSVKSIQSSLGAIYSIQIFESLSLLTVCLIKIVASMLSTAIFHCGWQFYQKKKELRALAVLAIQRSQVPVYMTAFGVIKLSYANFISVLRSSYSFFAVMY